MVSTTLGMHETVELGELIMSCVKTINCMGTFIHGAKDPTLKAMLQKHMTVHVQDYNIKVEWISKGNCQEKLNVPPMPQKTTATDIQMTPITPNPQTTALDDRTIATAYLFTLKRSGREQAWAAMECCDPNLRTFLEDAFVMCSHHALEVWSWMYEHGYYPASNQTASYQEMVQQTFKPVPQNS